MKRLAVPVGQGQRPAPPAWTGRPLERTSVYRNLEMIGRTWTPGGLKTLVADTRLEQGTALLAAVKPVDLIELGVAEWAPDRC
jgi:hypothetical protein